MGGEAYIDYWQLLGPQRFLDQVLSTIGVQTGSCILLCRPLHAPVGLAHALQVRSRSAQLGCSHLEFRTILQIDPTKEPFAELCRVLGIDEAECEDIPALLGHQRAERKLLYIDLADDSTLWARWKEFLPQYAHANRARPVANRSPICMVVSGRVCQAAKLLDDVALQVRYEYGVCDLNDMAEYAARRLHQCDLTPLQRRLAIAYCAQIALWDPEICDRLTAAPWPDQLAPQPILEQISRERQWMTESMVACWYDGTENYCSGFDQVHTAYLFPRSPEELSRRLFIAQLAVLLPYVEQRRPLLIKKLDRMLKVPYQDKDGRRVAEKHRLEVGHIESQLRDLERCRKSPFGTEARKEARILHEVRNSLSHLDLLEHDRLSDLEPMIDPREEQRLRLRRPRDL